MFKQIISLRDKSISIRAAALLTAVFIVYLATAAVCWRADGLQGAFHVGLAALACLIGAEIALLLNNSFRRSEYIMAGLFAGTFARMSVPLALAVVCMFRRSPQPDGPMMYLLLFYPLILALEIMLSIPSGGVLKCE